MLEPKHGIMKRLLLIFLVACGSTQPQKVNKDTVLRFPFTGPLDTINYDSRGSLYCCDTIKPEWYDTSKYKWESLIGFITDSAYQRTFKYLLDRKDSIKKITGHFATHEEILTIIDTGVHVSPQNLKYDTIPVIILYSDTLLRTGIYGVAAMDGYEVIHNEIVTATLTGSIAMTKETIVGYLDTEKQPLYKSYMVWQTRRRYHR